MKKRPVWLARDLQFHCCGPDCCGGTRPRGFWIAKKGTKCFLVRPKSSEKERMGFLRSEGDRYFLVELEGKRRYLLRSDLMGEEEVKKEREKSKSRLGKLAKRKRG